MTSLKNPLIRSRKFSPTVKKLLLTLFTTTLFFVQAAFAQETDPDFMRSMGKMYVVVAVIVVVFLGIVFYVVRLDRKITKLEDQINLDE